MITIFLWGSRRSNGVPSDRDVFLRLLVGELGTPKLSLIFAYGKWLPVQNATTRHVRSGPQMSENAQFWGRMYFPTKYLRSHPKITPNFGGPFNAKPITHGVVRKSHVNGATKLKLYSYRPIGIGKYLGEWGVSKFFPLEGVRGNA